MGRSDWIVSNDFPAVKTQMNFV